MAGELNNVTAMTYAIDTYSMDKSAKSNVYTMVLYTCFFLHPVC